MRWDEHGWDFYGPPQMMDIRGGVDSKGNLVGIDYTAFTFWQHGIGARGGAGDEHADHGSYTRGSGALGGDRGDGQPPDPAGGGQACGPRQPAVPPPGPP